jgi:hypothetical protein
VWSGTGAAVGIVPEGVNVHSTLGVGVVTRDVPRDGRLATLRGLLEGHGAFDVRVSAENSD